MRGGSHSKHHEDHDQHDHAPGLRLDIVPKRIKEPLSTSASSTTLHKTGNDDQYIKSTTQAVIWIKKAANGSVNWVEACPQAQFEWYLLFKKTKYIDMCAKIGLLCLALFESPSNCKGTEYQCVHANSSVYSWNLPVIPLRCRMSIAACFYLFILGRLLVRRKSLGDIFSFTGWYMFQSIVCLLGTTCCFLTLILASQGSIFWLITIMCRPLLVVGSTKKLRSACTDIIASVRGYYVVLLALFLTIWVFIWMGMVLYCRTPEGKSYFFSWADGIAQMWILFTTSNDPNAWIPAYSTSRFSGLFFILFLVIMIYFLLSLLLAKIYQTYQDILGERMEVFLAGRNVAIRYAFDALAKESGDDSTIDAAVWSEFFVACCDPYIGKVFCSDDSPENAEYNKMRGAAILSRFMPDFNSYVAEPGGIGMDFKRFKQAVTVFMDSGMYIQSKEEKRHMVELKEDVSCCPSLRKFMIEGINIDRFSSGNEDEDASPTKPLQRFDNPTEAISRNKSYSSNNTSVVRHNFDWDDMVNLCILIAMPVTLWASVSFARPKAVHAIDLRHYLSFQILLALSCLYTIALTIKISTLGFERFWYRTKQKHTRRRYIEHAFSLQNRFDFLNVYLLMIVEITFFLFWPLGSLARVIIILHLFRGFRLLALAEPLQDLFKILTTCLPFLWQMVLLLFVVYYLFAVLGQYLFGGLIYTTNPTLAGTNFSQGAFWPLNFNDLPSGMVTLFALMIVNNWYEIAQGFMLASHSNLAAAYFVIFFVIVNLIVLNIVIALILDCIATVFDEELEVEAAVRGVSTDVDLEHGDGVGSPIVANRIFRKILQAESESSEDGDDDNDDHASFHLSARSGAPSSGLSSQEYGTFSGDSIRRGKSHVTSSRDIDS